MARKLRGDRVTSHVPQDWVEIGPWQVMVCGPARAGGSWLWAALRLLAAHAGKVPCPESGEVDDARLRNLIGSAWIELDPTRAWILRGHVDLTSLLHGWRLVVVHRDPREIAASIVAGAGAPFDVAFAHLLQTTELVDRCARLPGSPVLTVPWRCLCDDPGGVLHALARFVELDPAALDVPDLLRRLEHPREAELRERSRPIAPATIAAALTGSSAGSAAALVDPGDAQGGDARIAFPAPAPDDAPGGGDEPGDPKSPGQPASPAPADAPRLTAAQRQILERTFRRWMMRWGYGAGATQPGSARSAA